MSDLIDKNSLLANCRRNLLDIKDESRLPRTWLGVIEIIAETIKAEPSVDAVVFCKDCKHWNERTPVCNKTKKFGYGVNDYCSKAQLRVEGKQNE